MRKFIGTLFAILDERRHEVALIVVCLICAAAVWATLLVWTQ